MAAFPSAPLPRRPTLAEQVGEFLRDALRRGVWADALPGEHELSGRLQVSRMTLRAALADLTREGWIEGSQGRRRRVVRRTEGAGRPRPSHRILLLSAVPLESLRSLHLLHIDGLREHLARAGLELDVQVNPRCFAARPGAALAKLARARPAAVWVVMNSSAALQEWMMARGHRCVIVGARHPGISLPSIGTDYLALGRHAAGQLLRRGHRELAVLLPNEDKAGHTHTVEGFRAAVRESPGAVLRVVRHDGTPAGLRSAVRGLFAGRPATGLLVALPQFAVGAATSLLEFGLRPGRDVSLIARDDDPMLGFFTPAMARYQVNVPRFVRRLSRLVLATASGNPPPAEIRLLPEFIAGETLGPVGR